ncbi:MAG: hypothetical protein ACLGIC_07245 [Acidimicrobiia bacterium]
MVVASASMLAGGVASAGEVTGSGKGGPTGDGTTGMLGRAASVCAFSGLEDGVALIGFGPSGPIFIEVDGGPGEVQTPHHETAAGIIHAPGIPGQACRGGGGG